MLSFFSAFVNFNEFFNVSLLDDFCVFQFLSGVDVSRGIHPDEYSSPLSDSPDRFLDMWLVNDRHEGMCLREGLEVYPGGGFPLSPSCPSSDSRFTGRSRRVGQVDNDVDETVHVDVDDAVGVRDGVQRDEWEEGRR